MKIGMFAQATPGQSDPLGFLTSEARAARDLGAVSFWTSQTSNVDALTALALIGREVPDLEIGTGVVPIYTRHPQVLAQQALTVNIATGGRLQLGIGLSHKIVVEGMWGYSFDKPLQHMREYLDALL